MNLIKYSIMLIVLLVVAAVILFAYRQHFTQTGSQEAEFLNGAVPTELPNGFYRGTSPISHVPWLGKKFDRSTSRGINLVGDKDNSREAFPFKTYIGQGNVDNLSVLKIDYDLPENLPLVRLILDEVVQTQPDHFLGKLILRLPGNLSIPLGYFELDKADIFE